MIALTHSQWTASYRYSVVPTKPAHLKSANGPRPSWPRSRPVWRHRAAAAAAAAAEGSLSAVVAPGRGRRAPAGQRPPLAGAAAGAVSALRLMSAERRRRRLVRETHRDRGEVGRINVPQFWLVKGQYSIDDEQGCYHFQGRSGRQLKHQAVSIHEKKRLIKTSFSCKYDVQLLNTNQEIVLYARINSPCCTSFGLIIPVACNISDNIELLLIFRWSWNREFVVRRL